MGSRIFRETKQQIAPPSSTASHVSPGRRCDRCAQHENEEPGPAAPSGTLQYAGRPTRRPWLSDEGGASLDDATRSMMEARFSANFADVRIHDGDSSARSVARTGARAVTRGHDIYFAPGQYLPGTQIGGALLAHELTHVLQQRHGRARPGVSGGLTVAEPEVLEREAEQSERSFEHSMPFPVGQHAAGYGVPQPSRARAGHAAATDSPGACESCTDSDDEQAAGTGLLQFAGHPTHRPALSSGGGTSLDDTTRRMMEARFSTSFVDVRVHDSGDSARSVAVSGARAVTRGHDIYFAPGHYAPRTMRGGALLAHELTHVLQQRHGRTRPGAAGGLTVDDPELLEREAEHSERRFQHSFPLAAPHYSANPGLPQPSMEEWALRAAAMAGQGIDALADYAARAMADDPLVRGIVRLRGILASRTEPIVLSHVTFRALRSLYQTLRAHAPGWLPLPAIELEVAGLPAAPILVVGGVALGIAEILLILAFIIVLWWVITNSIPSVRRQRERDIQRVIDAIEDALRPPPVLPAPPQVRPPQAIPRDPPQAIPQNPPRAIPRAVPRVLPRVQPRRCTQEQWDAWYPAMHAACNLPRGCSMQGDTCETATAKVAAGNACIFERERIQRHCYRPGDPGYEGHMLQLAQAYAALRNCEQVMMAKCT